MKVRLQVGEHKSADAEKDWLLNEVNKGLTPGRGGLKFLLLSVLLLLGSAAIVWLLQ